MVFQRIPSAGIGLERRTKVGFKSDKEDYFIGLSFIWILSDEDYVNKIISA